VAKDQRRQIALIFLCIDYFEVDDLCDQIVDIEVRFLSNLQEQQIFLQTKHRNLKRSAKFGEKVYIKKT
jgi:hypothetical protein